MLQEEDLFIGPRIEGLNVGIDDAARASNAIKQALEKNNILILHQTTWVSFIHSLSNRVLIQRTWKE